MAFSHLAHDCQVANDVVICNGALVAGHVSIGDKAFISGNVVIHQFVRIGSLAMVGGLSRVNQDIPPFMMVVGDSKVWGVNLVGLRRAGFARDDIRKVKQAYNLLYRQNLALKSALKEIENIESAKVKELLVFILASKRGICGPKKSSFLEKLFLDYPYFLRSKIPTYSLYPKTK
jgi:UDP-N-acetylglucosamine acyltransferase